MADNFDVQVNVQANPNSLNALRNDIQKQLSNLTVKINEAKIANYNRLMTNSGGGNIPFTKEKLAEGDLGINLMQRQAKVYKEAGKAVESTLKELRAEHERASSAVTLFGERIGLTTKRLAAYLIPAATIFQLSRGFNTATESIIAMDKEVNRLTQILDGNADAAERAATRVVDLAAKYGQSGKDLLEVTDILAQAGDKFSGDNLVRVTEALAKTKLAATFGDIKETGKGVIAVLNQFNLSGAQTIEVLDVANQLSKKFAFESENMFTAVQAGGASFAAAGGNMKEFAAMVAALRQLTRLDSSTIGTGISTLSQRALRPEVIRFQEDITKSVGGIRKADGTLMGYMDRLRQVAKATKDYNEEDRQVVIEKIADLRQGKLFIPLLMDMQKNTSSVFEKALDEANVNSIGSLTRDSNIGLKALQAQINSVGAEFEKTFLKIANDPAFKEFVGEIAFLTKTFADMLGTLGPVLPLLLRLGSIKLGLTTMQMLPGIFTGLRRDAGMNMGSPGSAGGLAQMTSLAGLGKSSSANPAIANLLNSVGLGQVATNALQGPSIGPGVAIQKANINRNYLNAQALRSYALAPMVQQYTIPDPGDKELKAYIDQGHITRANTMKTVMDLAIKYGSFNTLGNRNGITAQDQFAWQAYHQLAYKMGYNLGPQTFDPNTNFLTAPISQLTRSAQPHLISSGMSKLDQNTIRRNLRFIDRYENGGVWHGRVVDEIMPGLRLASDPLRDQERQLIDIRRQRRQLRMADRGNAPEALRQALMDNGPLMEKMFNSINSDLMNRYSFNTASLPKGFRNKILKNANDLIAKNAYPLNDLKAALGSNYGVFQYEMMQKPPGGVNEAIVNTFGGGLPTQYGYNMLSAIAQEVAIRQHSKSMLPNLGLNEISRMASPEDMAAAQKFSPKYLSKLELSDQLRTLYNNMRAAGASMQDIKAATQKMTREYEKGHTVRYNLTQQEKKLSENLVFYNNANRPVLRADAEAALKYNMDNFTAGTIADRRQYQWGPLYWSGSKLQSGYGVTIPKNTGPSMFAQLGGKFGNWWGENRGGIGRGLAQTAPYILSTAASYGLQALATSYGSDISPLLQGDNNLRDDFLQVALRNRRNANISSSLTGATVGSQLGLVGAGALVSATGVGLIPGSLMMLGGLALGSGIGAGAGYFSGRGANQRDMLSTIMEAGVRSKGGDQLALSVALDEMMKNAPRTTLINGVEGGGGWAGTGSFGGPVNGVMTSVVTGATMRAEVEKLFGTPGGQQQAQKIGERFQEFMREGVLKGNSPVDIANKFAESEVKALVDRGQSKELATITIAQALKTMYGDKLSDEIQRFVNSVKDAATSLNDLKVNLDVVAYSFGQRTDRIETDTLGRSVRNSFSQQYSNAMFGKGNGLFQVPDQLGELLVRSMMQDIKDSFNKNGFNGASSEVASRIVSGYTGGFLSTNEQAYVADAATIQSVAEKANLDLMQGLAGKIFSEASAGKAVAAEQLISEFFKSNNISLETEAGRNSFKEIKDSMEKLARSNTDQYKNNPAALASAALKEFGNSKIVLERFNAEIKNINETLKQSNQMYLINKELQARQLQYENQAIGVNTGRLRMGVAMGSTSLDVQRGLISLANGANTNADVGLAAKGLMSAQAAYAIHKDPLTGNIRTNSLDAGKAYENLQRAQDAYSDALVRSNNALNLFKQAFDEVTKHLTDMNNTNMGLGAMNFDQRYSNMGYYNLFQTFGSSAMGAGFGKYKNIQDLLNKASPQEIELYRQNLSSMGGREDFQLALQAGRARGTNLVPGTNVQSGAMADMLQVLAGASMMSDVDFKNWIDQAKLQADLAKKTSDIEESQLYYLGQINDALRKQFNMNVVSYDQFKQGGPNVPNPPPQNMQPATPLSNFINQIQGLKDGATSFDAKGAITPDELNQKIAATMQYFQNMQQFGQTLDQIVKSIKDTNVNISGQFNVTGFEGVGKDIAVKAVLITALDSLAQQLGSTPQEMDLRDKIKNVVAQLKDDGKQAK